MRSTLLGIMVVVGVAACGNLTHDGKRDETKGKVQQAAGDITGDSSLQAKGSANKVKGKTEKTAGKIKDAVTNP